MIVYAIIIKIHRLYIIPVCMHLSFCGSIWVSIRPVVQILSFEPFVIAKHELPGDHRFVATYIHCITNVENVRVFLQKETGEPSRLHDQKCNFHRDFTKKNLKHPSPTIAVRGFNPSEKY